MTLTAEQIRELVTRIEGTKLDFKRQQYDWANAGNVELAKDLMAMANAMHPHSVPSYILIGVAEEPDGTCRLVGVSPPSHVDDADLHQRVSGILNKTPDFSYYAVVVDGLSIGVYEIRPGGRPFFAIRDRGRLVQRRALVRDGSSTASASPDQIQEWAREDDADGRELRRLELEKVRAQLAIVPHVQAYRTPDTGRIKLDLRFTNQGERPYTVTSATYEATLSPAFYTLADSRAPATPPPPATGSITLCWPGGDVQPGGERRGVLDHLDKTVRRQAFTILGPVPGIEWSDTWITFTAVLICRAGEREEEHRLRLSWP